MKTILIKCGGSVIDQLKEDFFASLAELQRAGFQLVFVHGGGPDINEMLELTGVAPEFHNGLRKTTKETLNIVEMVLSGKTNRKLVHLLNSHHLEAIGINGTDNQIIQGSLIDEAALGYVGNVEAVNNKLITKLLTAGLIPVITPLGITENGQILNINADYAAAAVAKSLNAEHCLFVTDVDGILIDGKVANILEQKEVHQYIEEGQITGGMIPKVTSSLAALESGLKSVMIVSGKKAIYDGKTLFGTQIVEKLEVIK
ncbi:acetylglutamate kinase [Niallia sp. NCCP-28]|uniref:acetylglutamate kinase n=1 Tax=Niallia sp. NCCP-28 TaxID=2934712 RepID=UPI00207EA57A|nr:acetylglutamate kinase [Niallia sp. NCCP-28]GKU81768.1 acetylglutamate kinase [Niallia sp. NCCP-28]